MRSFKKISVITIAFVFLLSPFSPVKADNDCNIVFDQISNYAPGYIPGWVQAGVPLQFKVRASFTGDGAASSIRGIFEISSPDGAIWQPMVGVWSQSFQTNYPNFFTSLYYRSNDGQLSDTIVFNSQDQGTPKTFVSGSSEMAWIVSLQFDSSQIGKTICFDSVSMVAQPFGHTWIWALTGGAINCSPAWNGSHCFEIVAGCCQGIKGDVNGDGVDNNIVDLNFLVNKVFRSGPLPPCAAEADLDGDGQSATILDLNYLVNFIWRNGASPGSCP